MFLVVTFDALSLFPFELDGYIYSVSLNSLKFDFQNHDEHFKKITF